MWGNVTLLFYSSLRISRDRHALEEDDDFNSFVVALILVLWTPLACLEGVSVYSSWPPLSVH